MGFYDMVTDNYEWMLDWYDPDYYRKSPEHNPQGPSTGAKKWYAVVRPMMGKI